MKQCESLDHFYTADHHRLDDLFKSFQELKSKDPEKAKHHFAEFRAGLEQHMAWEESILFPEFDDRLPAEREVTEELRDEHSQLIDQLEAIEHKLDRADFATTREEARLLKILTAHNRSEEDGLYPKLDCLLNDEERSGIHQKMKDAAW